MIANFKSALALGVLCCAALAQDQPRHPSYSFVRASGDAVVTSKPDRATLDVGVNTQAKTAQAAAGQNAAQLDAVMNKIRQTFGSAAELKTIGYSVSPNYSYPKPGDQPVIASYTASNILEVKLSDIALAGKVIDVATQSGANSIQSLQFSLKDEFSAQADALRQATVKARAKAEAMASALSVKVVRVLSAEEGGVNVVRPTMYMAMGPAQRAAAPQTPVESGTIEVRATVTVTLEVSQ